MTGFRLSELVELVEAADAALHMINLIPEQTSRLSPIDKRNIAFRLQKAVRNFDDKKTGWPKENFSNKPEPMEYMGMQVIVDGKMVQGNEIIIKAGGTPRKELDRGSGFRYLWPEGKEISADDEIYMSEEELLVKLAQYTSPKAKESQLEKLKDLIDRIKNPFRSWETQTQMQLIIRAIETLAEGIKP